MSLETHVTNRYDDQILAEITNPRDPSATADVDAQITRACDEVEAVWFPTYVQVAYDDTLPVDGEKHVAVAVMGVVALLRLWANPKSESANKAWTQWIEIATQAANTFGGRGRVRPTTTSTYTHETQDARRPEFDDSQFEDFTLRAPDRSEVD